MFQSNLVSNNSSPEDSIFGLLFYYFASSWGGQSVHVGQKSSSLDLVCKPRNQVHWTWFVSQETEFIGLVFYT